MRNWITAGAVLAASINGAYALTSAELCGNAATNENNNYYCKAVKAIAYSGVGGSGSYKVPTSMSGGACAQAPKSYDGPMAPMDEDVSGTISLNDDRMRGQL